MNDIVVFGATGFVGKLVAGYLVGHAPRGLGIALAGRSLSKLEQARASLGRAAADWPLVVADSADPASLVAMAAGARVVATTVGPYRGNGMNLVDACIAEGAHYADLTGEVLFAHEAIQRHEKAAEAGVRIVHSCGFDSIPSDLGVLLLHQHAGPLGDTKMVVAALKGGFSGGTLASMKGQIDELRSDKSARRVLADPYALSPGHPRTEEPGLKRIKRDPDHGWIGPFVMASYNTRIVRRSHFLIGYGPSFRYREVAGYGNGAKAPVKALAMTAGLGALGGGLAFKPTRKLLDRVLPDPGQGPGENARRHGFFRIQIDGAGHRVTVAAKGDPGYAATAVMMGESALCLALDTERLPKHSGVLTPATALGTPLVERLRAAGMTFDVNSR